MNSEVALSTPIEDQELTVLFLKVVIAKFPIFLKKLEGESDMD